MLLWIGSVTYFLRSHTPHSLSDTWYMCNPESQSKKIEELLNSISEAASEHEKEKCYFTNNETNLRMQIHRLRDVVKDMKVN